MQIAECNPFVRAAQIQPAVLEGSSPRIAYDHRIFLILDGNGTIFIGNRSFSLSPNSFIFFPAPIEYYFRGKMKVVVLNFDMTRTFQNQRKAETPVPREEYDISLRFDTVTADGLESPMVFHADALQCDAVMQIVAAFSSKSPCGDAIASATLKKLLAEILDKEASSQDFGARLSEKTLLYIRSNAAEIKNNEQLARVFGYHPIYLASLIKEKTGKTLHRTILEERIRLACRFLRSTENSVEQIAFDTGFSSRNHFCTVFRSIMGISPLVYRGK